MAGSDRPADASLQGGDAGMQDPPAQATQDAASMQHPSGSVSEGCGIAEVPAAGEKRIEVGGVEREYIVGLPENYDPNRPYRLVFAWHGLGGSAAMIARNWYGMQAFANDSAIFISGQALESAAQGGFTSWYIPGQSDIPYVRAMLEWARLSYCIDNERVFSVGMSNGGMMSNIVGCELGDEFRAIAAMSGGGPRGYAMTPCTGQIAAWISHGNQDSNVPFSYGLASRDYWLDSNGCDTATTAAQIGPCVEYEGCQDGYPVQFCEFDGGHMIPSYSGEAAWAFFAGF